MRKRFKIPLIFFVSIFLIIGAAIALITFTDIPEDHLNDFLKVFVESRTGIAVHVGEMNRSWWNELELRDVRIRFKKGDNEYDLASISSIRARYSIFNLIRGKFLLDSLIVSDPVVELRKDSEGNIMFISGGGDGDAVPVRMAGFFFGIDNIRITDGRLFLFDSSSVFENINIDASLQRQRSDQQERADMLNLKIDSLRFDYPSRDFRISDFAADIYAAPGRILIDNLSMITGESNVSGDIEIITGDSSAYRYNLSGTEFSFEELSRLAGFGLTGVISYKIVGQGKGGVFWGEADLDGLFLDRKFDGVKTGFRYDRGKLSFNNISGKIFDSQISGDGWLDFSRKPGTYHAGIRVRDLNLNNVVFNSLDTDFNGRLTFDGRGFHDKSMFMSFNADLGYTRIEHYEFNRVTGRFDVTTRAVSFKDDFKAFYKNTDIRMKGRLEYGGDLDISGSAVFRDLNDFDGQIFLKDIGGVGKAVFFANGPTEDFNLFGTFSSDSSEIYGIYAPAINIGLSLNNFISHPEGEVKFGWAGGDIYSFPTNSVEGYIVVAGDYTFIDSVKIRFDAGNAYLSGKYDGTVTPGRLELDSTGFNIFGNKIANKEDLVMLIGEKHVEIAGAELGTLDGEIGIDGIVDYDNNMNLKLWMRDVDIAPYASLLDTKNRWDGRLSCDISIGGDFDSPLIEGSLDVRSLGYRFYTLGDLDVEFNYDNRNLSLNRFELKDTLEYIGATASIPVDLSFGDVETRVPDSPFHININADGEQLNAITVFIPQFEYFFGKFDARMFIGNTVYHPTFNGAMKVQDGILKIRDFVVPVYGIDCNIKMNDDRISIEKATGRFEFQDDRRGNIFDRLWSAVFKEDERKGNIGVKGDIVAKTLNLFDYDLHVRGHNVPLIHEVYDITALVDVDARIRGSNPPTVSGDVDVIRFYYNEPFASAGTNTQEVLTVHAPEEDQWDLNLDISADNNIWVINPDMEAEFEGEVNLTRRRGLYRLQGEINTIRGRYYLPPLMDFRIDEGRIIFNNPEFVALGYIDPELDVKASTSIYQSEADQKLIELQVTGRLSEPELRLYSDGDSQQDIIEYLAFHRNLSAAAGDSLSAGPGKSIGDRGVGLFSDLISNQIQSQARRSLGVETLEITPSQSGNFNLGQTRISVGKYISPSVYLKYSRMISETSGQEIAAEYRLNRNFSLQAKTDANNLYHVDLNFKIEFK